MALSKLRLCDLFWVAWTEFGSVGVGRRAALGQNDKSSEGSGHPGLDPVQGRHGTGRKDPNIETHSRDRVSCVTSWFLTCVKAVPQSEKYDANV